MMSNKRPKSNVYDRSARTTSDSGKRPPNLHRQSTGSEISMMTGGLTITCSEEKEEAPNLYLNDSLPFGIKAETHSRRPLQDISMTVAEANVPVSLFAPWT